MTNTTKELNVMTIAWGIAKEAVIKFGGTVKSYFSESLKQAWAIIKNKKVETTMTNLIKENTQSTYNALHTYNTTDMDLVTIHGLVDLSNAMLDLNDAATTWGNVTLAVNNLYKELVLAFNKYGMEVPTYEGDNKVVQACSHTKLLYSLLKTELLKKGVQYYTAGDYISTTTLSNSVINILERRGNDWTIQSLTALESTLQGAKEGTVSNQQVISACVDLAQSYEIETMKFIGCDSIYNVHDGDEVGRYVERLLHNLHNLIVG